MNFQNCTLLAIFGQHSKTMKRAFNLILLIVGFGLVSKAQVSPHALGVRLAGDNFNRGAEVSYQHGLGDANRLEFDLGVGSGKNHDHMFLAVIYQWHWNITGGLNWYAGPGGALGFHDHYNNDDDHFSIAVGGQVGLEYDFSVNNAPIQLSIDARPLWDFIGDTHNLGYGTALGIRYVW